MYYEHFGLNQAPFRITPNTDFFFSGGNRGPILEALIYAVLHGEGIIKVSGEVGSGKTMLCNMLMERLKDSVETVYLANPSVSPEEILHAIAFDLQLRIERDASRLEVMQALQQHLLKRHAEGKRVVIFVEESQGMPLATLEEIRLLSNLETKNDKLLQIVLFGQPELDENLREPSIRQLRERITNSFKLEPLNIDEVREYLMFRVRAAGYHGPDLFSDGVVKIMARASGGLTRRVNLIADKTLLAAFSENTHTVKQRHVEAAIRDSSFSEPPSQKKPTHSRITAAVLIGAGIGVGGYMLAQHNATNEIKPATSALAPSVTSPAAVTNLAATPAVIEPAPTITAEINNLFNERIAATNEWLVRTADTNISIQLLSGGAEPELKNYLNNLTKFIEINDIFVYRTVANRQPGLSVLYGSFTTQAAAEQALAKLPVQLKSNRPILRTVQGIRAELKKPPGS